MTKTGTISPAIWFLGFIIAGILAVLGFFIWLNADPMRTLQIAFTPSHPIAEETLAPEPDYTAVEAWYRLPADDDTRPADIFYIHPTTLLDNKRWNDGLEDPETIDRTLNFALRNQASALGVSGRVFAPKYRQATFGAFFDTSGQGLAAIGTAHLDVLAAFDAYMDIYNDGRPFVLVGHSQGALHLLLMLKERIAERALQKALVAAYVIGWPVSIEKDIDPLDGITVCASERDTQCVLSWQTFGVGGDAQPIVDIFNATPGLNGTLRAGSSMLCTNPLTWTIGGTGSAALNTGSVNVAAGAALLPPAVSKLVGAACGQDGILYLDAPLGDAWRDRVMAGNNYHVYDINLFHSNLAANIDLRIKANSAPVNSDVDETQSIRSRQL